MAKRGGQNQPTALLKLVGSKSEKYVHPKTRALEPKPPVDAPPQPKMTAAAGAYWKWLIPKIKMLGILSLDHRNILKRYCCAMARWDILNDDITTNGITEDTNSGTTQLRASYRAWIQVSEECRRIECEFGMTPSSRAGVQAISIVESAPKDPRQAYFR